MFSALVLFVSVFAQLFDIEPKPASTPMLHNGALNTAEDFAFIKSKVDAKAEPWISGWNLLIQNSHAQTSYKANPVQTIIRGGGSGENYANAYNDAHAAFQLGLRWKITGESQFADAAIAILNAWAKTCTGIGGDTNGFLAAGLYGYEFAVAGEIIRNYKGWAAADFKTFQNFMLNTFYPTNLDFLVRHSDTYDDHYWANWDLCNVASVVAIGIVADRRDIYNVAVEYLQNGIGNGNLNKAINYIHTVDGEDLGQIQESGRDQGHATLCIALIGMICQLTWNQGDDFFGYKDNRFLKGCEYVAKYNVALKDVPFHEYVRVFGNNKSPAQRETYTVVSDASRGNSRPMYALPYYHYASVKKVSATIVQYTKMGMEKERPEGGGGNYGSASGGYDQLGFGTLLFTA